MSVLKEKLIYPHKQASNTYLGRNECDHVALYEWLPAITDICSELNYYYQPYSTRFEILLCNTSLGGFYIWHSVGLANDAPQ